jgi:hypothetical protein
MLQSVINLLGTKPTDDWGRATLNRRGVLTCASAMRKRSLLSGRPSYYFSETRQMPGQSGAPDVWRKRYLNTLLKFKIYSSSTTSAVKSRIFPWSGRWYHMGKHAYSILLVNPFRRRILWRPRKRRKIILRCGINCEMHGQIIFSMEASCSTNAARTPTMLLAKINMGVTGSW